LRRRDRSRSRTPPTRRGRSPVREGSAERRAKIEQWNREREERDREAAPAGSPRAAPRDSPAYNDD
jgi:splicing factor U2AF subunit